jgi:hypothetical protein
VLTDDDFREDPSRGGLFVKPAYSTKDVVMRDEHGQILYAVVGMHGRFPRVAWTDIRYFSASSQEEAILRFKQYHWAIVQMGGGFHQVIAGPAIGFFVHDNHGDSLSTGGTRPAASPLDRGTAFEGDETPANQNGKAA